MKEEGNFPSGGQDPAFKPSRRTKTSVRACMSCMSKKALVFLGLSLIFGVLAAIIYENPMVIMEGMQQKDLVKLIEDKGSEISDSRRVELMLLEVEYRMAQQTFYFLQYTFGMAMLLMSIVCVLIVIALIDCKKRDSENDGGSKGGKE